eukprot:scaffold343_cov120-Isochrysis_galbana.AAC.16
MRLGELSLSPFEETESGGPKHDRPRHPEHGEDDGEMQPAPVVRARRTLWVEVADVDDAAVAARVHVGARVAEGDTAVGGQSVLDGADHHRRGHVAKQMKPESLKGDGEGARLHRHREHDDAGRAARGRGRQARAWRRWLPHRPSQPGPAASAPR